MIEPLTNLEIAELKGQVEQLDGIFGDNEDGTIVRLLATLDSRDRTIAELRGLKDEAVRLLEYSPLDGSVEDFQRDRIAFLEKAKE